ncbi:hypothetical protein SLINC_1473 [Streptomyces lincolnensis]|uniref:Uncharacterized protein n=1 Tax=Streptomyces lincolnensis TaxID=1915 RepID=A0A1B1M5H2_STRLN|nr:hypothetical protein [Streptomyces lincolnensis]ANS63697.1 hypothetical protein SLINC_1473 [Streptomyces lincolnensis]AXG52619.1 hypothetical protein SLCG_1464 [Streptomyces lincolnensis]QMV05561.1 hypothetical protein GJU35_07815 [Streptomyces lincolnensis]
MDPASPQLDPRRTRVVVVGIDTYEAGDEGEPDGPVAHGVRFAEWFMARGVPPERITALFSGPADRTARHAGLPYAVRPADRDHVHRVLLQDVPASGSELLWVVWGGRGLVDTDGRRRLFYADTAAEHLVDPGFLDFDALLSHYRSDAARAHPRQIWLVDACQEPRDPRQRRGPLPREDHGAGRPVTGCDQAVLFAARPGETAVNLTPSPTGLFSRELLAVLGDTPGAQWPPDLDAVAERVRERLGDEGQLLSRRVAAGPADGTPGRAAPDPGLLRALTDGLLAVDEFVDPGAREVILGLLRPEVRAAITRHGKARMDAISVVRTCWRRPGALQELAEAVLLCAGASPEAQRLHRLVTEVA